MVLEYGSERDTKIFPPTPFNTGRLIKNITSSKSVKSELKTAIRESHLKLQKKTDLDGCTE